MGEDRKSYSTLLHQLHLKPFRCVVALDDNRCEDGKELREEYEGAFGISGEDLWLDGDASVLEVLISLADHLAFSTDLPADSWFWKLIENLELKHYRDSFYSVRAEHEVDQVLEVFLSRTYSDHGVGGVFPLRSPRHDQRKIELWYQLQAYLLEGERVYNGP